MLDKINLKKIMLKEEYKQEVPPLKQKMGELQQSFKQAKVPVIVLFEGWGASGKGSLMSNVILTMDPRGFHVESTTPPTLDERRHLSMAFLEKSACPGHHGRIRPGLVSGAGLPVPHSSFGAKRAAGALGKRQNF